jgi:hypothetical protein
MKCLIFAALAAVVCLALLAGKDDIRRFLRMRRMWRSSAFLPLSLALLVDDLSEGVLPEPLGFAGVDVHLVSVERVFDRPLWWRRQERRAAVGGSPGRSPA